VYQICQEKARDMLTRGWSRITTDYADLRGWCALDPSGVGAWQH